MRLTLVPCDIHCVAGSVPRKKVNRADRSGKRDSGIGESLDGPLILYIIVIVVPA